MSAFLQSMALPFLACLILTGIHVYLGIHVLSRKVIFVDLALAQVAALGAVWGMLLGWDQAGDPWVIKGFSLAFTFIGAAVFSLTRMRNERVPHEALIGITYAVALGGTILMASHLAHGAEEVSELLAGSILWVRSDTIFVTTLLYSAIGLFHYIFRRPFFAISLDPDGAEVLGLNVRMWDFLFYVSFGFVVTSSVSIAGVLLVFSFLVIPAVVAMLYVDGVRARLCVGWLVGTLVSAIGCSLSYFRDLPSGPTIVACFGAFLLLAGLLRYILHTQQRGVAIARVAGGTALLALMVGGSQFLRKSEQRDVARLLKSGTKAERLMALLEVEEKPELWPELAPLAPPLLRGDETEVRTKLLDVIAERKDASFRLAVQGLLTDPDDGVRQKALRTLHVIGGKESADAIFAAASHEDDEYIKVEMAEALLELGDARGVPLILDVIEKGEATQARREAFEHLKAHVPIEVPFDPGLSPEKNTAGIAALRKWWADHQGKLALDRTGVFQPAR